MGVIQCSRHGRQFIRFVSSQIDEAVASKRIASTPIFCLKLNWCGQSWLCPVDTGFLAVNTETKAEAGPIIAVDDEEEADKLIGRLRPVCSQCLSEYLQANSALPEIVEGLDSSKA
jgi:hypothetical protein